VDGVQGGLEAGDPLQALPHKPLLEGKLGLIDQGQVRGRGKGMAVAEGTGA